MANSCRIRMVFFSLLVVPAGPLQAQWVNCSKGLSQRVSGIVDLSTTSYGPGYVAASSDYGTLGLWIGTCNSWTKAYAGSAGNMALITLGGTQYIVIEPHTALNNPIVRLRLSDLSVATGNVSLQWRRLVARNGTLYAQETTCLVYTSTDGVTWSQLPGQPLYAHGNCFGALGVRPSDGAVFQNEDFQSGYYFLNSMWIPDGNQQFA